MRNTIKDIAQDEFTTHDYLITAVTVYSMAIH